MAKAAVGGCCSSAVMCCHLVGTVSAACSPSSNRLSFRFILLLTDGSGIVVEIQWSVAICFTAGGKTSFLALAGGVRIGSAPVMSFFFISFASTSSLQDEWPGRAGVPKLSLGMIRKRAPVGADYMFYQLNLWWVAAASITCTCFLASAPGVSLSRWMVSLRVFTINLVAFSCFVR